MLATLTDDRFSDPDWIFERKLDGVRCLARRDARGRVRLLSRTDRDMSRTYPEIADALAAQADGELFVDGEIVALAGRRTSFERLQGRLGLSDPDAARASGIAVFYYVFDLLHLAGHDIRRLPRAHPQAAAAAGAHLRRPAAIHAAPAGGRRGGVPSRLRAR